jgi:hypothetical protein
VSCVLFVDLDLFYTLLDFILPCLVAEREERVSVREEPSVTVRCCVTTSRASRKFARVCVTVSLSSVE